jgi:hypothetical protein
MEGMKQPNQQPIKGKWINGIWWTIEDLRRGTLVISQKVEACKIISNNPKGYNTHKPNPKPARAEEVITKETIADAYRELWKARRLLQSKAQIFSRLNKVFLGLDRIDEEFRVKELK